MNKTASLCASLVMLAMGSWASSAHADSNEAMCEVRKDGETKQGQSGPCTFSQRQGYIDLDLRNGETYSLVPGQPGQPLQGPERQQGHPHPGRRQHAGIQVGRRHEDHRDLRRLVVDSGGGGGAAGAIAVADMSRYCAGEASAKFKVSPRDITTQNAKQTQGMYEVWGQYGTNAQVFICSFNAERQFLSVDLYRP